MRVGVTGLFSIYLLLCLYGTLGTSPFFYSIPKEGNRSSYTRVDLIFSIVSLVSSPILYIALNLLKRKNYYTDLMFTWFSNIYKRLALVHHRAFIVIQIHNIYK